MNFQALFTTARVVTAVYRITSTTLLLIYLARRVRDGRSPRRVSKKHAMIRGYDDN